MRDGENFGLLMMVCECCKRALRLVQIANWIIILHIMRFTLLDHRTFFVRERIFDSDFLISKEAT